jgi:hypothetical protein
VRVFQDKLRFTRLLKSLNLAYPPFAELANTLELTEFRKAHGPRVVCKPADSSASRGVTILESGEDDDRAFARASAASSLGNVIAQSYIAGTEHGIECFIDNGKCELIATTDKLTSGLPSCVVLGHRMPSVKHDDLERLVAPQVDRIVQELGLRKAQINFDVILDGGPGIIIDAGLRPGGNYLQNLVSRCYEFNPWRFYISIFCDGMDQTMALNPIGFAGCQFILARKPGRFQAIVSEQVDTKGFEIHQLRKKGDIIHPVDCAENRVAAAVVSRSSAEDVDRLLNEFHKNTIVEVA